MSEKLGFYDGWQKGDVGTGALWRADPKEFDGQNVVVLPSGGIAPARKLRDLQVTSAGNGIVRACGFAERPPGNPDYLWWLRDDGSNAHFEHVNAISTTGGGLGLQAATQYVGGLVLVNNFVDWVDSQYRYTHIVGINGHGGFLDHGFGAFAPDTAMPPGRAIAVMGDFLCVGGTSANPNRLWYSAPQAWSTWPTTNFIDFVTVSHTETIVALRTQRDRLIVFFSTGRIYVVSGTLGVNNVDREFMPGEHIEGVAGPRALGLTNDQNVWFGRRGARDRITDDSYLQPVKFTGAELVMHTNRDRHVQSIQTTVPDADTVESFVQPLRGPDGVIVAGERHDRALMLWMHREGVWTFHAFGAPWGATRHPNQMVSGNRGELYVIASALGAPMKVYAWQYDDDPFIDSGPFAVDVELAGSENTIAFPSEATFAHIVDRKAHGELSVTYIDVLVRRWNNPFTDADARIQCEVSVSGIAQRTTREVATTTEWLSDEEPDAGLERHRFNVGSELQPGTVVQVRLTELRYVSVEQVIVWGNIQPPRVP